MSVLVRIPTPLQKLVGDQAELQVEAGTLRDVVSRIAEQNPEVKQRLLDDNGAQLACASGDKVNSALTAFHTAAFSPKVSLTQSDPSKPLSLKLELSTYYRLVPSGS